MGQQDRPLVTFVVPCYNSAAYMGRAVDSLLAARQPCEILLVNDGSTDATSEIAHDYAARDARVRAIDQDNANWGGAVNHGLELARGRYFKVLDSDDYFEPRALNRALDTLAEAVAADEAPDLLLTNYLYDHLPSGTTRVMRYHRSFPQGRTFAWNEAEWRDTGCYIMIHAAWYATELLRTVGVELPTGVSYMDSVLLLRPLVHVRTLRYLDEAPYCYVIGREGQSVDIEVIRRHIDEQLLATRLAIDGIDYAALARDKPVCAELVCGYMRCMLSVSTLNLLRMGTPEARAKDDEIWRYLRQHDPALYRRVRWSWCGLCDRRTALGRFLALRGYDVIQRIYKIA